MFTDSTGVAECTVDRPAELSPERRAAMDSLAANDSGGFIQTAMEGGTELARHHQEVICDDLWEELDAHGVSTPQEQIM